MGMEIQVRHSTIGERKISVGGNNGVSVSAIQSEGGGSEDDSSIDEPQPISLKKSLKNDKESNNNDVPPGSSVVSLRNSTVEMTNDDHHPDDDECSGPSTKEGGVSTSFTSGENSDAEGGLDGEEMNGSGLKLEDSRKCFECDVCNMTFSNGANMRRHRMRHTGVKPYECRVCQKRFFRKDHLAEHMATHSKLLPFRCPICNKGFQRQIAMRAHFQNEHVGGSHDMVKACPLCSYKAGSMKSLRVHFRSRHGIDLDNPMPHSSSLACPNGTSSGSPGPNNGEYSELAHALGFEDRDKLNESMIPSHFLVPQIEISSNSSYPSHYSFSADSSYNYGPDERSSGHGSSSPANVSPQSDSSSNLPTSSDLVAVVVKKEVVEDHSSSNGETKDLYDKADEVQDMPEDLSSGNGNVRASQSPKCCSSSFSKVSPLKSLLRDEWKKDESPNSGSNSGSTTLRSRSDSSSHSNSSGYHAQSFEGEAISSSIGIDTGNAHSMFSRRGGICPSPLHQCVFCGIIFPDKTLYFLHKGCHSESNPWKCNICGESCSNVYDFNSHLLSKSHQ
ncbi:unnamed protein product [Allacma fusca]|uniref:C2H2-type domain-containing protein n=1 Tax=Allacma fusca TaxID=39272 RepID=A0A8J2KF49_9HEXA|nr:unnamed protein product [Allacma fusca]